MHLRRYCFFTRLLLLDRIIFLWSLFFLLCRLVANHMGYMVVVKQERLCHIVLDSIGMFVNRNYSVANHLA